MPDERVVLAEKIRFIMRGSLTRRYHTQHTIKDNLVGTHSFGVAWFVWLLTDGRCRVELLMAALSHDLGEQVTGDVSSPTKRRFPDLAKMIHTMESETLAAHDLNFEASLSDTEHYILKLADNMDGAMFCITEMSLGNIALLDVYKRYVAYITELKPTGHAWTVFTALRMLGAPYAESC